MLKFKTENDFVKTKTKNHEKRKKKIDRERHLCQINQVKH